MFMYVERKETWPKQYRYILNVFYDYKKQRSI